MKTNPIADKLLVLIHSGKTTKEKICVVTDLKYHALNNIFTRSKISKLTLKCLLASRLITKAEEEAYLLWELDNGFAGENRGKGKKRGRPREKRHEHHDNKLQNNVENN